jgi:regulator of protease activity HflC (stomatin/prohibitin superfamily)
MFRKIHIRKHERGLWFRKGDLHRLLTPGTHVMWHGIFGQHRVEVADTLKVRFEHPLLEQLVREEEMKSALMVVDLTDTERALVWKDARLFAILGPGRHALWDTPHRLAVEVFDISKFRFEHPRMATVLAHRDASNWLDGVQVDAEEQVLLYRDGVLIDTLSRGLHVYWKHTGKVWWKAVDLRELAADVGGQEIMTNDKVTLRVNLLVTWQIADALKSMTVVADAAQTLYRDAQLVLRAAVGTRSLDALLSDKESVGNEVREALAKRTAAYGVAVRGVGLRDIMLPGDMKLLLNQVIAATKEAEANLIRRREETAAARSQANTAKLLAENPQLARLKELELLQSVLAGSKATFVFGGGDIAEQVRGLVSSESKGS